MTDPILTNIDPKLFKIKNDEIEELKSKTEKDVCENFLKALKWDNDYCRKYKSLNKKMNISENLIGSSLIIFFCIKSVNPNIGILTASSCALTSRILFVITNEFVWK